MTEQSTTRLTIAQKRTFIRTVSKMLGDLTGDRHVCFTTTYDGVLYEDDHNWVTDALGVALGWLSAVAADGRPLYEVKTSVKTIRDDDGRITTQVNAEVTDNNWLVEAAQEALDDFDPEIWDGDDAE